MALIMPFVNMFGIIEELMMETFERGDTVQLTAQSLRILNRPTLSEESDSQGMYHEVHHNTDGVGKFLSQYCNITLTVTQATRSWVDIETTPGGFTMTFKHEEITKKPTRPRDIVSVALLGLT